jgi:thioredoxin 1
MKTIELTDVTFETLLNTSRLPVLVDFGAAWCPPCRAMEPTLENLADELEDKATIGKVDVDANPLITAKFGIRNLPTFMLFKNGVAVERIVGAVPKNLLQKKLTGLINS